jgi:hypothetical protein
MLQAGRSWVRDPMVDEFKSTETFQPLGPVVHSASNKNEYQKQKYNARPLRRADNCAIICEPNV